MKKLFLLLLVAAFANVNAQVLNPVKWKTRTEKLSETEFYLVFDGTIDDGWHVYSQFTPDGGPLPIEMGFDNKEGKYRLIGKTDESKTERKFNDVFGVDEIFFSKKVVLKQKVKILSAKLSQIMASIDFQVCKDVCINGREKFTFAIPKMKAEDMPAPTPLKDTISVTPDTGKTAPAAVKMVAAQTPTEAKAANNAIPSPKRASHRGLLSIFFIAFLSGFAALLTPCVFPLIPMTVSFFTKQSKTRAAGIRNAITYGISIIIIYVLLGSVVTAVFGADALNSLATNVWFNLIFFLLLMFFAASFLGAFEIVLPNSWANKVDRQADRGGFIGILFMALALAIVSFSCTGPIVGTLLFEAASRGGIGPVIGMFGFSLALALPFMLFAMFPGWLNTLPKSGGWLNTVKVFLGFLELALAFKFLSNADLVMQMHLLEREVFLCIWIAVFGALALYLFGKITMPHDSPLPFISVGRLLLGLLVLSFTAYLVPGLWGAPLKLISAFPPPLEYSESPHGVGNSAPAMLEAKLPDGAKIGPHDLVVFDDYEKGLAYAKSVHKPMMLDFTGFACVNCRKMENNVWSDPKVFPVLRDKVVLISLYVDDKRKLPESERYTTKAGDKIETIGDKWTDFILTHYNTNSQPFYVLVGYDGKSLNTPVSYSSVDEFAAWLTEGIGRFQS